MPRIPAVKNTCSPKTAVAYARYSSAGQRDVSIDQQLADIRAFAAREGYTIVHEYADRAKSGYRHSAARVEFQAMLSAAASATFDTVIAWKVDRFGRNRRESAIYKGQLADHGIRVVYAMEPIPTGAAGIITEGMLESIAEWYSANLSENVKRGLNDNASKCICNGAHIYGYRKGPDNRYAIDDTEAAVVRRVFSLYSDGYSMSGIVSVLSSSGLAYRTGRPFTLNHIYNMLHNKAYIGVYKWGSHVIPGGMPVIIDGNTWRKCEMMMTKTGRHYESGATDYLLTGKCFCGHCSRPMIGDSGTSRTGTTHYYYSCQGKKTLRQCDKKSVRKDWLEDAVINFICDIILSGPEKEKIADAVIQAQKERRDSSPLRQLEKELADVKRRLNNINEAIAEGIWSDSTAAMLRDLSEQEAKLQKSIDFQRYAERQLTTRSRVLFFLDHMSKGDRQSPEYRKRLIRTFVNSVTVYDDHLRIALNAIEGAETIPIETLPKTTRPSGSDSVSNSLPKLIHSNHVPPVVVYAVAV